MKKIIIILLLIIAVGVTLAVTHVYAQNNPDKAAQPKEKVKIENPIKEVEVLDYEVESKTYEYSTMSKSSKMMEVLIEGTGVLGFTFLILAVILGLFARKKVLIRNLHIIIAVLLFICASAHLVLNILWRR